MALALTLLGLAPLLYQQNGAGGSDPLRTIHAMVQRGDYSDAMEAIAGLPEPHKSREEAFLGFETFNISRARDACIRALAADPKDTAVLRTLGDVAFIDGDLRESRARYDAAASAAEHDPRLGDADRAAENRTLEQRRDMLDREESYRGRVRSAERRAVLGAAGILAFWLGCLAAGIAFVARASRRA
jgi:hypothetical protein